MEVRLLKLEPKAVIPASLSEASAPAEFESVAFGFGPAAFESEQPESGSVPEESGSALAAVPA